MSASTYTLPTNYGLAEPVGVGYVVQEINDEWYVFHAKKFDEETGEYYGAIVAGAETREEALLRASLMLVTP